MPEAIQSWLGTRLGVLLDVAPDKFGRNTKDGRLLARLLYSYGVIPAHVLNNVKESKNFYECYNNLVVLKPWLRYIGVIHDDCTLQQMAGGEGSAAISVFYAVYLNLERKDRLHYLSAQKERRISEEGCKRFRVSWVPERYVSPQSESGSAHVSALFLEKSEMLEWHKEKCKQVVEQIKKTKARFRRLNEKKRELGPVLSKHASSQPLGQKQSEAEKMRRDIDAFEAKHGHENPDLNFSELLELQNFYEMQPCFQPNATEAKNIVSGIKRRKKGETYARTFQQKMQTMLLDEQWKEVVEKQEKDFENAVCAKLLKQSQYEKQMMKRLYLLRNQKKIFAENRRKIESLKIEVRQREDEAYEQAAGECGEDDWVGEGFEKERMAELHRRMYNQKVQARRVGIRAECQRICEALIDIAIRISEARELIGCQVPKSFMKDLLELFFKDLPIFDVFDHFEELYDQDSQPDLYQVNEWGEEEPDGYVFYQSSEYERLKKEELDRQIVLDECDFNDYLQLMGPWLVELLFPYGSQTEEKNFVLGYIVHKVLAAKYPPPNVPVPVDVKPMKYKSVVHGLKDETARAMLTDLLEIRNVMVVRVEDAISFVLAAYKEELPSVNDVQLTFQRSTEDALKHKFLGGKEKEVKKKMQLFKAKSSERPAAEEETQERLADKETQTPKIIPDADTPLSANANLGKQAFESLGLGDPVPDSVVIPAIVAYVVAKQEDHDGWVLLNYPRSYCQASELEAVLTGCRNLPPIYQMESEDYNYRGPWGDLNSKDLFCDCRNSRLVPNSYVLTTAGSKVPKTYFNSFIKLKKVSDTPHHLSQAFEDFNLERFYFDSEVLFDFEYQNLNFQAIKNLGKAILGAIREEDGSQDLTQKTSVELFGSAVLDVGEKWDPKKKNGKEVGGLKKASNENKASVVTENSVFEDYITEEPRKSRMEEEEKAKEVEEKVPESSRPKPGDPNWEWATGSAPKSFMVAQASLWEKLEAIYVEDFKNVFFCLRVHRYNLINYCGFLKKSLRTVMRRGDEKQKVLADFQHMFNEIDEDLRPDEDIKCELHVRVSELEQALMGLADERKSNSLKDVTKMAQDNWVPDEMASLVNTFLTALQLEVDRCVGSCQVITDYYLSIQQKVPDEKTIPKVFVPMLQMQDRKYSVSSTVSKQSGSTGSPRYNDSKRLSKTLSDQNKFAQDKSSKTRSLGEKKRRASENNLLGAADFIADILTNLSLPEDGLTPFHTFFMDNVKAVTNEVKSVVDGCISEVKKADKPRPSTTRQTKGYKKSEMNIVPTAAENLVAEWLSALENELARFIFRTQLILARGIFEMNEFLTTVLNILFALTEEIMEMYLKEIQSISECCKVFRCGIEEEVKIRPRLELKDEQFIVHLDDQEDSPTEAQDLKYKDERERYRFTIDQLSLLFYKLQRAAPGGEIIKRSLMYIFEDLRVLKPEVQNSSCFPDVWSDLEPEDVVTVLNEVYQNLEVVHWKDFIIYALDLPLPGQDEILTMRHLFRKHDPQVTELINRENYETVSFWFENSTNHKAAERAAKAKDLLYRMYQVNAFQTNYSALLLAFCKDENPVMGFEKALALSLGKPIQYKEDAESVPGENWTYDYGAFRDSERGRSDGTGQCSPTSSEQTPKCVPKERIVRCTCKDVEEESSTEESSLQQDWGYNQREMEGEESFYYAPEPLRRPSAASLVPFNILSSLLKASFPSLPQFSILLDCEQTFQETLSAVYDSLESHDNNVEVHRLINHKFINRLLFSTNKFKFVKLKPILMSLAKVKSPMPRVVCIEGKPKLSKCLRN